MPQLRKPNLQKRTGSLSWDDLRCVLAIARAGSLSGAARELRIEHSTVFRRLNAIEKRLGVRLFERSRAGYTPTAHGELAATAAGAMESEALRIERRVLGADAQLKGVVRLATSELFAGFLLPRILKEFLASNPEIEIELDVSNKVVDLTRREADLALRATMTVPEHLIGHEVGELRYAVYAAADLCGHGDARVESLPWLGFDDSVAILMIARWQRAADAQNSARVRFNSIASMLQAAAEGLGVAILPLFAADRHPGLARIGPILEQPRMKLWVLSHLETRGNARVAALSRHLVKRVPQILSELQQPKPA